MLYKIFISYSTVDLPLVNKIKVALESKAGMGVTVYIAEYSALPGVRLDEDIKRNLSTCDLFCVLWSRNAKDSGWVQQEIGIAEDRRRLIVPIVLDRDLPPPGFIQDRKFIPAYEGTDNAIKRLMEIIAANASRKTLAIQEQKVKQRNAVTLLGLGVLILAVLASKD